MGGPGSISATERWAPELADLDLRPTGGLLRLFVEGELAALQALRQRLDQLAPVVDAVAERFAAGGRIVYTGAGTAGRLGLLDAAECGPTFGLEPGRVTAVVAGGSPATTAPREDAEDRLEDGRAAVKALALRPMDALVALSASGRTPFTVGTVGPAAAAGALTVAVVCDEGTPLAAAADLAVELPVGPELLAGSTRLKAGTVQKIVANALSTLVMVRTGRTFGNLMVDLKAANAKLRDRARRIVASATATDLATAERLLSAADGEVKTAIVTGLTGEPPAVARARLARCGGRVREAADAGRRQP